MITRLKGTLVSLSGPRAEIELGDLAYEVLLPAYLAERLAQEVGQRVELVIYQYLESEGQGSSYLPRLIGFGTAQERRFFELFTTVKGIGNRKALRAMAAAPSQIAAAISARDTRRLTELPEIGKRLAETIIAELSGKVESFLSAEEMAGLDAGAEIKGPGQAPASGAAAEQAIEALIALGETRTEAERKVLRAVGRLKAAAGGVATSAVAGDGSGGATADDILAAVFRAS